MTKTCANEECKAQFETEDETKTLCPTCEAAQKPAEETTEGGEQPAA